MVKVELNYDPVNGNITDQNGLYIGCCVGLDVASYQSPATVELKADAQSSVSDLIKLKDAGFTADEIMALRSREVI